MREAALRLAISTDTDVVVDSSGNITRGSDSIVVDNTNPAIVYEKGWQTDNGTLSSHLRPRGSFNDTLHVALERTELSYNFTGSYVEAWLAGPNAFECFLDGVKLSPSNKNSSTSSLFPICTTTTSPKQHTLQITVNGTAKSPFWMDFIRYVPTNSTDLRHGWTSSVREFSLTTMRHHELLSQQWDNQGSYIASMVPGASLIFNFTGASVAGLGIYDNNFAHNSSVGSYAVDDQTPTYFLIENLSSSDLSSLSNQVLFQTPQYSLGPHQIEIVYYGSSETAPLLMTSLLVHNQTMNLDNANASDVTPPVSSTSLIPAPTASPTSSSGKQGIDGASPIIFGLCGAFLGILGVLGLVFLYTRRRRRSRELAAAERAALPFPPSTEALVTTPSKCMRQLRLDTDTSQITLPAFQNPLRKTRGQFSAHVLASIVRTQRPIQAPTGQVNIDVTSVDPRRSPSLHVLVHEDSGMRLSHPIGNHTTVVEVPPTYTPL